MIKKLFAIFLIAIGSFLEIWYYQWRFARDGIDTWLSSIIGIALTLLLSILIILKKDEKKVWFLILPLVLYSVFATSAGQSFSLSQLEKTESVYIAQQDNAALRLEENRELKKQYQDERKVIAKRINDIPVWSREYRYKEEIGKLEKRRDFLDQEILKLNEKIDIYSKTMTISEKVEIKKNENIYTFYNKMTGIAKNILQFVWQTVLSIFIAVMAPVGIILIMNNKRTKHKKQIKPPEPKPDIETFLPIVKRWVQINWTGLRQGKSENILPKNVFFDFVKKRNEPINKKQYNNILKAALIKKIIKKSIDTYVIIEYNEYKAIELIMEVFNS